jgi:long-chain acyl-CoA synthetase
MTALNELLIAWQRSVASAPGALAVIDAASNRRWTREELAAEARRVARELPTKIAARRVVFSRPNGVEWFACFLALLEVGAVAVPVDPTESLQRQDELAREIGAAGVWRNGRFCLNTSSPVRQDRQACVIKLTSGSTGKPRALRFTGAQLLADGSNVCRSMDIRPNDVNLAIIPLGHSYGLGNLVIPLLTQGTAVLVARAPLPRVLAEDCERWQPTVFPTVPALLKLLASAEVPVNAFRSLRTIISAGSPLPPEVAQAFHARFGQNVHSFYGSSETGGITYDRSGDATLAGRSVGTPLDGVRLTLQRGDRFAVESAAVHTLGNRQGSPGGIGRSRPPDRGRLNEWGELVLLGRVGRLAKIAGRRIDLGELESSLRQIPGVSDAYVVPHPTKAEELAAAVQTELNERVLRDALSAQLPAWKIPRRLVCLQQFPLTGRGKTDAAALRRSLGSRTG